MFSSLLFLTKMALRDPTFPCSRNFSLKLHIFRLWENRCGLAFWASQPQQPPRQAGCSSALIVFATSAVIYSSYDAYQMTARDQIHIPIDEAADYLASHMSLNESAVIVCAFNLLNQDMLRFYLPANMSKDQSWQYPDLPVDSFTPNFNITEFVSLCQQRNVKYIILFDFGPYMQFFNSTLDYTQVKTMISQYRTI